MQNMNILGRILVERIKNKLQPNKVILLFGARRVGKTVLIRQVIQDFKGKVLILNGEDDDTLALLNEKTIFILICQKDTRFHNCVNHYQRMDTL